MIEAEDLKNIGFDRITNDERNEAYDKWFPMYGDPNKEGKLRQLNCSLYRVKDDEFKVFTDRYDGEGFRVVKHRVFEDIPDLKKFLYMLFKSSRISDDPRLKALNRIITINDKQ